MSATSRPAGEMSPFGMRCHREEIGWPGAAAGAAEARGAATRNAHTQRKDVRAHLSLGSEGKPQGPSEREGGDPVPLHAVAWHGRPGVRPSGPDLCAEVLGRPHAGDGPRAGALQVGLAPFSCLDPLQSRWGGGSGLGHLDRCGPAAVWFRTESSLKSGSSKTCYIKPPCSHDI